MTIIKNDRPLLTCGDFTHWLGAKTHPQFEVYIKAKEVKVDV
jgi:hypothetical protein